MTTKEDQSELEWASTDDLSVSAEYQGHTFFVSNKHHRWYLRVQKKGSTEQHLIPNKSQNHWKKRRHAKRAAERAVAKLASGVLLENIIRK